MTDANKAAQTPEELELYNAVNLVREGFVLREKISDAEAQPYLSAIEYVIQTALTTPAANTGELKYALDVIEHEVIKEADSYFKNRPEATPGFAQVIVDSWKMIKSALQRPEPSEGVKALLARLETGARSNSDAMQCYDSVRESTIEHPGASLPRDIFESFIDSIADDVAALAPRQVDVTLTADDQFKGRWQFTADGYYVPYFWDVQQQEWIKCQKFTRQPVTFAAAPTQDKQKGE